MQHLLTWPYASTASSHSPEGCSEEAPDEVKVAGDRVIPVERGSLNGSASFTVGAGVSDVADSPKTGAGVSNVSNSPKTGAGVSDSDELPSVERSNMETAKD